jgi:hypothetical protein
MAQRIEVQDGASETMRKPLERFELPGRTIPEQDSKQAGRRAGDESGVWRPTAAAILQAFPRNQGFGNILRDAENSCSSAVVWFALFQGGLSPELPESVQKLVSIHEKWDHATNTPGESVVANPMTAKTE